MVADIKDTTPNPNTIEMFEKMLEDAKAGKLRTAFLVLGWDDDSVTHGWSMDERNTPRRVLAELVMAQHDMVDNIGLHEQDSVLYRAIQP